MADTAIQVLDEIRGLMDEQLKLLRAGRHEVGQARAEKQSKGAAEDVTDFGRMLGSHARSLVPPQLQPALSSLGNVHRLIGQGARAFQHIHAMRNATGKAQAALSATPEVPGAVGGGAQVAAGGMEGAAAGGLTEGAAGLLAIPGLGEAVAVTAVAFIGLKAVLYDLPKAIYNWTQSLLESQRASAQFSPQLAAVFLRHDVREMTRERAYGEATAGSTGALQESLDNFADALVPLRSLVTNILNTVGTDILDIMTAILELINEWFGATQKDRKDTPFELFQQGAKQLQEQGGARAWANRPAPFA